MQKRGGFFVFFLISLISCIIILLFAKTPFFTPVNTFLSQIFAPIISLSYNTFSSIENFFFSSKISSLQTQNQAILKKLVDQNKLAQDNKALRDQFATSYPRSLDLLPADVVGAPSFIPGFSAPQSFIIDKGSDDGVEIGSAVVYKNNLLGKVTKTSEKLSSITLINNSNLSFIAKTLETNAQGLLKGQGGVDIILDEVLLSETLKNGDFVLTKGSLSEQGVGFPPDLIVGKITSVSKKPSDLFQKAQIKSEVDFTKIGKVFVVIFP